MSTTTSLQKIAAGALTVSCAAALTFYGVKLSRTSSYSGVIHKLNVQHGDSPLSANYNVRTLIVPSLAAFNRSPDARAAFAAMRNELRDVPVLGIDAEWERGRPLALLQIASPSYCFIFQLRGWAEGECPAMVRELLEDAAIVKVGVGLRGDASRLLNEFGVKLAAQCDLSTLGHTLRLLPRKCRSLAAVTLATTGVVLGKDLRITLSAWETSLLSQEQVAYAADDAICAVFAFLHLYGEQQKRWTHAALRAQDPVLDGQRETEEGCDAGTQGKNKSQDVPFGGLPPSTTIAEFFAAVGPSLVPSVVDQIDGKDDEPDDGLTTRERQRKLRAEARERKALAAAEKAVANVAQWAVGGSVRVLSIEGHHIFSVDQSKAKWYVEKRKLAYVTKRCGDAAIGDKHAVGPKKDVAEIQLLFEPKVKTKLCMNWQLGSCPMGDKCPFAHGSNDFVEDKEKSSTVIGGDEDPDEEQSVATAVATPSSAEIAAGVAHKPQRPMSCAICRGSGDLLRHSVVPPAFRKFLPSPFNAGTADDFFLICLLCNQRVRMVYDLDRKQLEEQLRNSGAYPSQMELNKMIRHAQVLTTPDVKAGIPKTRQDEMIDFIQTLVATTARHGIDVARPASDLLEDLAALNPSDVHNSNIVDMLVGGDAEKAVMFIRKYRDMFEDKFRPHYVPWRGGA